LEQNFAQPGFRFWGDRDVTALDLAESRTCDASGPSSFVLSETGQTPKRFQIIHNALRNDIVVMQVYECHWRPLSSKQNTSSPLENWQSAEIRGT
jgi:hypothetical protein